MNKRIFFKRAAVLLLSAMLMSGCARPSEDIQLRRIQDVVVDASSEPMLKANALFYNPNRMRGKLRKIKVDIFINGKRAAHVDQDLKTKIPAQAEFTVPLEVKLALKELGFLNTLFGVIGGKKFDVRYEGFLRLNYRGVPIRVPVDYNDEVSIRF